MRQLFRYWKCQRDWGSKESWSRGGTCTANKIKPKNWFWGWLTSLTRGYVRTLILATPRILKYSYQYMICTKFHSLRKKCRSMSLNARTIHKMIHGVLITDLDHISEIVAEMWRWVKWTIFNDDLHQKCGRMELNSSWMRLPRYYIEDENYKMCTIFHLSATLFSKSSSKRSFLQSSQLDWQSIEM